jgi:hypothetical protein
VVLGGRKFPVLTDFRKAEVSDIVLSAQVIDLKAIALRRVVREVLR